MPRGRHYIAENLLEKHRHPSMNDSITIFVGTMTGTAELVAEEISDTLSRQGRRGCDHLDGRGSRRRRIRKPSLSAPRPIGQGDVPDNAQALLESLQQNKPDLSDGTLRCVRAGRHDLRATFCFGGKLFDQTLQSLGAERVGDILLHDASSGTLPEDMAADWAAEWFDTLAA